MKIFCEDKFQTKIQFEDTTFKVVLLVRSGVINLKLLVRSMVPALGFFVCFYMLHVWYGSANRTLVDLFSSIRAESDYICTVNDT